MRLNLVRLLECDGALSLLLVERLRLTQSCPCHVMVWEVTWAVTDGFSVLLEMGLVNQVL